MVCASPVVVVQVTWGESVWDVPIVVERVVQVVQVVCMDVVGIAVALVMNIPV